MRARTKPRRGVGLTIVNGIVNIDYNLKDESTAYGTPCKETKATAEELDAYCVERWGEKYLRQLSSKAKERAEKNAKKD